MVTEKAVITEREYNFMKAEMTNLLLYGQFIANRSYPVAGYGFYSPTVYKADDCYFFSWQRGRSCD